MLFCMYINHLPDVLTDYNIHMYAEDIRIYTSTRRKNINSSLDSLNSNLLKIDILSLNVLYFREP